MIKMHGISGFARFLERYARTKTPRVNRKVNSKNRPERVFHRERGIFTMKVWNIAYNKTLCKKAQAKPDGKDPPGWLFGGYFAVEFFWLK